ncbi:MAG TPA: RagB/SusD family nutrient uptake outer membrane protein [Chitinophagaceae bacterium]|nr:RagB/SusD family nutrient uptake outer membrane protein [Chitinophagaceae bacterium]
MKKTLLILSIGLLASCKKSFLDLAPISNANVQAFYKTPNDIMVAVNACYASLQLDGQYRYAYWQFGEVRSDNTYNWDGAGNFPDAEIDQFKETSANAIITAAWEDTYHGIQLCNVVLNRINGVTMSDALKNQYIGEAEFLRALMYFNLVRIYGEVPLVTKETSSVSEGYSETRMPVEDVYAQIVADLTDAAQKLPVSYSGADIGRATKGAATGLLGKVYLTQGMYDKASSTLQQVISSGNYHLLANYADLWNTANANNAESLFEVQFKKGGTGTGSNYYEQFAPRNSGTAVTGLGFAQGRSLPTPDLDTSYENGDTRKDASIAESYVLNGDTVYDRYTLKFRDQPFIDGDADNHWPVLRYADVLLMYAEALNEQNHAPNQQAYDAVNQVRARAGLHPLAAGMSHDAFAQAVSHERRVELAFEGQRWFDLVRTGQALQVMNKHFAGSITVQSYQLLFPVPQTEVSVNPDGIKQNPGYN